MTDDAVAVRVSGLLRGSDLSGEGTVAVDHDAVALAVGGTRLAFPLPFLDGARFAGGVLELYLDTGDVVALSGPAALGAVYARVVREASAVPEVTLSLRTLGSRRLAPGPAADVLARERDRFFDALLSARRRAERATEPEERLAALDGAALRAALERELAAMAAARHPRYPPARRALEAELSECAEDLFASLDALARAAQAARGGDDTVRFAKWRAWAAEVRRSFARADECWLRVRPALEQAPPPPAPTWRKWTGLRALLGTLGGLSLGAALVAGAPAAARAQHVTLRIASVSADSLRRLGLDVVHASAAGTFVVADRDDRARLATLGIASEALFPAGASAARRAGQLAATATTVYRSYDDPARGVKAFLDSLAAANPRVHVDTIGLTLEGRPLLAAKIGAADDAPSRPNVLFMATYHAREWAATETALRLIAYLASAPAADARADSLLRRRDIWVLPVANPDGYEYTFTRDRLWRKNRRPNGNGSVGVDLNRNHAFQWGYDDLGSSPFPASEVYRGPAAESELETKAIVAFHAAHPPVAAVSFHTFSGLVLYPWGYEFARLPGDLSIFQALAGTDLRPVVLDHLPGAPRSYYHPAPGWNLYTTNGEYTDWAYAAHGTLAFTPEETSGFENGAYYGFEFPDDEAKLRRLFEDLLPFALDVLDAAARPERATPRATGIPVERVALESVSPRVRVRVPVADVATTAVLAPAGVPLAVDPVGAGRYFSRLVSPPLARPDEVTVRVGGVTHRYGVLAASGAEASEGGWTASGGAAASTRDRVAGSFAWSIGAGRLRSPAVAVPAGVDTVSVLFWTSYAAGAFANGQRGEVRVSGDGGRSWETVGAVLGVAPVFYPERADVVGYGGREIVVEFTSAAAGQPSEWLVDEITLVAHGAGGTPVTPLGPIAALRPTENPVRGSSVRLTWPFADAGGEVVAYDVAGRRVWRLPVHAGETDVAWDVASSAVPNGVYVLVARSAGRETRLKLFVARR